MGHMKELIDMFEVQNLGLGKKLGLKSTKEVGDWGEYFINDFIPKQGRGTMDAYILCNFDPLCILLWIALQKGFLDEHKHKKEIEDFLARLMEREKELT